MSNIIFPGQKGRSVSRGVLDDLRTGRVGDADESVISLPDLTILFISRTSILRLDLNLQTP